MTGCLFGGANKEKNANQGAIFTRSEGWRKVPPIPNKSFNKLSSPSLVSLNSQNILLWGGVLIIGNFQIKLGYSM